MRSSICLLVVLLACGKSRDDDKAAPAPAAAAGAPVDACTLLTRDEVVAAAGHADFSAGKSRDGGSQCRFAAGNGSVTVYSRPTERSAWNELKDTLVREGKTVGDVPDLGDAAYFWDQRVYVYARGRDVTVHLSARSPTPSAADIERDRAAAIALAKLAVARLPR